MLRDAIHILTVMTMLLCVAGCEKATPTQTPGKLKPQTPTKQGLTNVPEGGYYSTFVISDARLKVIELAEKLKDDDAAVRIEAASALGKMGSAAKDFIPSLTEALKDKDKDVRYAAQAALKKIQAEK